MCKTLLIVCLQPKACEDAESFEISSKHISLCISDLKHLYDKMKGKQSEYIEEGTLVEEVTLAGGGTSIMNTASFLSCHLNSLKNRDNTIN